MPIKILKKIAEKKSFLANFLKKFARKILYDMRIFSSVVVKRCLESQT